MNIFSLYGKTVKELTAIFKEHKWKYTSYKSKTELINGLILKLCFNEFKKSRIEKLKALKEQINQLRVETCVSPEPNSIEEESIEVEEESIEEEFIDESAQADEEIGDLVDEIRSDHPTDSITFQRIDTGYKSEMYKSHRTYIKGKYGSLGSHGERLLFHGTDERNIESIVNDDLLLTCIGKHGTAWGKGIYFSDDLKFASKYSSGIKKYVLLCRVHVGDIVLGKNTMLQLPVDPSTNKQYDTAVNHISHPNIFVKFKNSTYDIIGLLEITLGEGSKLGMRGKRIVPHAKHIKPFNPINTSSFGGLATSIMPNGTTGDGYPIKPGPKFKVGDKVYDCRSLPWCSLDRKPLTVIKIHLNKNGIYKYFVGCDHRHAKVWRAFDDEIKLLSEGPTDVIDPNITSMSVTNSTNDSICIYFIPTGKSYTDSVDEFISQGYIAPGETKKIKTWVGHEFACATKESIIKLFTVTSPKECITVE